MIKGIIFDFGGVLSTKMHLRNFAEEFSNIYDVDEIEFKNKIIQLWLSARTEEEGFLNFWEGLSKFIKLEPERIKKDMITSSGFREELLTYIITNLKDKYKLGILSNHIRCWLEDVIKEKNITSVFNEIITSYNEKIAKPNKEIYKIALKKLNLKAEETIYIDDMKDNVRIAKELGMKGIVFKDFNSFKEELEKILIENKSN